MTGLPSLPWGFEPGPASRRDERSAGWDCTEIGTFADLDFDRRPLRWTHPGPLWQSRNDRVATWFGDPTDEIRDAWLARLAEHPDPERDLATRVVSRFADRDRIAVGLLGDPGEGDASQYATVPVLDEVIGSSGTGGTDLAVVVSDVIYPAGGVATYRDHFFRAYRDYPGPIYGLPGNHDWYDDLLGFMSVFCGLPPEPGPPRVAGPGPSWRRALRRALWRRAPAATTAELDAMRAQHRPSSRQHSTQPGPYCAIDAGPVRLVLIDTGLHGGIDDAQATWLEEVSRSDDRPKILLTGKPLLTYGAFAENTTQRARRVHEIVRRPEHRYVAVIGGDDHNYQRYPVRLDDGRTLMHIVAGGSGAYMSATHTIPNLDTVDALPVTEDEFRCYPLRGDSLAYYSRRYDEKLAFGSGLLRLSPGEATVLARENREMRPEQQPRDSDAEPTATQRRLAKLLYRLPSRGSAPGHNAMSVLFDGNRPPLFKSFLRLDATADEILLSVWAATGCRENERRPACEDLMRARRGADGTWTWTSETPGRAVP